MGKKKVSKTGDGGKEVRGRVWRANENVRDAGKKETPSSRQFSLESLQPIDGLSQRLATMPPVQPAGYSMIEKRSTEEPKPLL